MTVVHVYEPAHNLTRARLASRKRQWAREDTLSGRMKTHTSRAKRRTHDDITPHLILVLAGLMALLAYFTFLG